MHDFADAPEGLDPDENLALEQPDDFVLGYDAGISEGLRLVRALCQKTQFGGEVRYPELRDVEAELLSLLDE